MQVLTPEAVRERVAFIVPRWTERGEEQGQGAPFRCFPVAGALFNHGYEVVWFDQEQDLDRHDRSADFLEALAGVRIAFFWTNELWPLTQLRNIQLITAHMKARHPGLVIAVGGTFPSLCPPGMLHVDGPVDYYLQGFGERAADMLVRALDDPSLLAEVEGLVWRDRSSGVWHDNPVARKQELPVENTGVMYRRLDLAPYIQVGGIFGNDQPTLIVGTGQGCGKRCDFCYWRNLNISILDPASIVDLVQHLRDTYGVRQFHLAELDFFANRRRPLELARLWRQRLPDCIWFALCSPIDGSQLSDDDWDTLAAGGCAKLELGTESGSDRIVRAIGKQHTAAQVESIMRKMVARGMHSMHNIIFGFPGETADDRRATLRLLERLHRLDAARITFAVRIYQPTPGTPLGDRALALDPTAPRTILDLAGVRPAYAQAGQRSMTWVDERDELEIKRIIGHYLPLSNSRNAYDRAWQRLLYRALRALARIRLRLHFLAGSLDERLYRRFLGERLSMTYRP